MKHTPDPVSPDFPELPCRLLNKADWRVTVCGWWRSAEHVTLLEARAALSAVVTEGGCQPSSRWLLGLDSRVALGMLAKGRSPSPPLNCEMLKQLPSIVDQVTEQAMAVMESPETRPTRGTRGVLLRSG